MADLTYSVAVNTSEARRSLDQLKGTLTGLAGTIASAFAIDQVVGIAAKFENLRVTLGILYKDTNQGAQAFNRIKDLAATSVFSVEDLTNTFIKLKTAGIEPTDNQLRLFADVSSVAADSVGALQAITDLYARTMAGGLGLEDLNRLADRGIPVFTILAKTMGLSRLEIAKFGQSADGAQKILRVLETELQKTFGGASAARANTLAQAMSNLRDAVSNLIDRIGQAGPTNTLTKFLQDLSNFLNNINMDAINKLIDGIKILVIAFGALVIIPRAVKLLDIFAKGVVGVATSVSSAGGVINYIFKDVIATATKLGERFGRIIGITSATVGPMGQVGLSFVTLAKGALRFAGTLGILYAAFEALNLVIDITTGKDIKGWFDSWAFDLEAYVTRIAPGLADLINRLGEMMGMAPPPSVQQANADETKRLLNRANAAKEMAKQTKDDSKALTEYNFALDRLRGTYKMLNEQMRRSSTEAKDRLSFQTSLIGKSDDEIEMTSALREELDKYLNKLQELRDKQENLRIQAIGEKDLKKLQEYKLEIDLIDKLVNTLAESYSDTREEVEKGIQKLQNARLIEQDRKNTIQNITKAIEDQIQRMETLGEVLRGINDEQQDLNFERSLKGLSDYEKQVRKIREEGRKAQLQLGRTIAAQFQDEDLSPERAQELAKALQEMTQRQNVLTESRITDLDTSRQWLSGWEEAFQQYADSAGNAAKQAQDYFSTFTQGFENAILKFVQTGKLSFKDLANSIIAQFVRIQAQQMLLSAFGNKGTGGFLGSIIGRMFGGGGFGTGSGFGNLDYGGFFAKGGNIMSGKFGVVGEAGPELVAGPASVTPLGQLGGQNITNVNYTINAVDAPSFRALVARDPQFIYSVTEAGRRSQPTRRLA